MILIDGYNLLHVVGIVSRGIGPGTFARARNALLNSLATRLDDDERKLTTVVFDSCNAPPTLPRELQHHGITVSYAAGYESADEMLEELIRQASAPRRLTVVSSDHRVQRAAKRRKARAVDSDVWYAEIHAPRRNTKGPIAVSSPKPTSPLTDEEVAAWLDEFGEIRLEDLCLPRRSATQQQTPDEQPAPPRIESPFPPGYAEDLLD